MKRLSFLNIIGNFLTNNYDFLNLVWNPVLISFVSKFFRRFYSFFILLTSSSNPYIFCDTIVSFSKLILTFVIFTHVVIINQLAFYRTKFCFSLEFFPNLFLCKRCRRLCHKCLYFVCKELLLFYNNDNLLD